MRNRQSKLTLGARAGSGRRPCQIKRPPRLAPLPHPPLSYWDEELEQWVELSPSIFLPPRSPGEEWDELKPLPHLISADHQLPESSTESFGEFEQTQIRGVGLPPADRTDLFGAHAVASSRDILLGEDRFGLGHEQSRGLSEGGMVGSEWFGGSLTWHDRELYASGHHFVREYIRYHARRQKSAPHFPSFSMTSTDPDYQELQRLGSSIRQIRIEKRLSVAQVAAGARMDEDTIEELEAGLFDPPYDLLVDIARGLGVPPAVIITRTEQTDGEEDGQ